MKKVLLLFVYLFALTANAFMYADNIVSVTKTQSSGEYVLYWNKTTGNYWAELKKAVGVNNRNQSLSFSNQWMEYDATRTAPASGWPKGYYVVKKILDGCYADHDYDEVEIVNSDILEIEPGAFRNTHIKKLRFHCVGNSGWTGTEDNVHFNYIKGPVPYFLKADYVLIADAQYEAWRNDSKWGNEDLIRCTNYEYGAISYEPITLDYSQQTAIREKLVQSTLFTNRIDNQYWEYSRDNGLNWVKVESHTSYFVDESPSKGMTWYRALGADGDFIEFKINYYTRIPNVVKALPSESYKIVEQSVSFTLDLEDDNFSYSWHKKEGESGATGWQTNSLNIESLHSSDAGDYYCVISNPLSTIYSTTAKLNVAKAEQKITLDDFPIYTWGNDFIKLPEYTDKNLKIRYQSSDTKIAEVIGNNIKIVKPGTVNIIASQGGNDDYLPATTVSKQLTINKATHTITPMSFEPILANSPDIILKDSLTSRGQRITFTSSNTDVATIVDNSKIHIKKAGVTTITASFSENDYYLAPNLESATLTVNIVPNEFVLDYPTEVTWGDSRTIVNSCTNGQKLNFTVSNPDVIELVEDYQYSSHQHIVKITAQKPGNATIYYSYNGYGVFEDVSGSINIKVGKKDISITSTPTLSIIYNKYNKIYNVPYDFKLNGASFDDFDFVTTTSAPNVACPLPQLYATIQIIKPGTTDVTIQALPRSEYYNGATSTVKLTIEKGNQFIEVKKSMIEKLSITDEQSQAIPISSVATAESPVSCQSSDPNIVEICEGRIIARKSGIVTLTFSAGESDYYNSAEDVLARVEVLKGEQVISIEPIGRVTFDDTFIIEAHASSGNQCSFESLTPDIIQLEGNIAKAIGVGSASIKVTAIGDNNTNEVTRTINFIIDKAQIKIAVDNKACLYGDEIPSFTYSIDAADNIKNYITTKYGNEISCDAQQFSHAGTYSIHYNIEQLGQDRNIQILLANDGVLTIKKLPVLCKVTPEVYEIASWEYYENIFKLSISSDGTYVPTPSFQYLNLTETNKPLGYSSDDDVYYKVSYDYYFADWEDLEITNETALLVWVRQQMTSISLDHTSKEMIVGERAQLIASYEPDNAVETSMMWSSSDPTVASVDMFGFVRALKTGSTEIKVFAAANPDVYATCTITVVNQQDGIDGITSNTENTFKIYSPEGKRLNILQKGINLLVDPKGKPHKVYVK